MWDDHKQMNALALTLVVLTLAGLVWAGAVWAARLPVFAVREVVVSMPLERANAAQLEAVVRSDLSGTLLTLDLDRARVALAQVPWVRSVALRRQWPGQLENYRGGTRRIRTLERFRTRQCARRSVRRAMPMRAPAI